MRMPFLKKSEEPSPPVPYANPRLKAHIEEGEVVIRFPLLDPKEPTGQPLLLHKEGKHWIPCSGNCGKLFSVDAGTTSVFCVDCSEEAKKPVLVRIDYIPEHFPLQLYLRRGGEMREEPCYLELDCIQRVLSCRATPHAVEHSHMLEWKNKRIFSYRIPCLLPKAANQLMEKAIPLAERILRGYRTEMNQGVLRGFMETEDAKEASWELVRLCDPYILADKEEQKVIQTLTVKDYFTKEYEVDYPLDRVNEKPLCKKLEIHAEMTDLELEEKERRIQQKANREGYVVVGLYEHLKSLRKAMVSEGLNSFDKNRLDQTIKKSKKENEIKYLTCARHLIHPILNYLYRLCNGKLKNQHFHQGTRDIHAVWNIPEDENEESFELRFILQ